MGGGDYYLPPTLYYKYLRIKFRLLASSPLVMRETFIVLFFKVLLLNQEYGSRSKIKDWTRRRGTCIPDLYPWIGLKVQEGLKVQYLRVPESTVVYPA